ncbi:MAG TPA: FAD-dependent oxidoreductase [Actinomycetota bacterium]|jgi:thioredoxin reductase (NADPH)|nr:FAD-dependent oxidoreductase [Actinomycetota bacterium]
MEANKPVLLTVDDDPGVSRAVARDLRRRYGQDHRIVRAESGRQALEALREIKLRGDPVAVLLADYRMPEMSGLEFLEQAMDLFPHARRALLTAYADTDAAIQAINVIDLDHYLLKPWDPPAERLYPVVDELIELWRTAGDKPVTATQVVGHRWSARSYEVRDFLARNSVSYRWLNADEPEGRGLLAAAGLDETSIPLVVTPEGDALVDPGVEELAARVGLSTTPATDFYDTVIVGGGPAGLGAAVYAASEGLRTVMVERRATGGQAGQSSRIENYLGFPDGVSGSQLTDRARRQASKFGAEILAAADVTGLEARGSSRVVRFADGGEVAAHTVVLATGVSYHTLEAPGVEELTGRGIFYGSTATEAPTCAGEDVYVVGGANAAGQAAVFLARHARQVTMLVRADGLERSMSHYLIRQIRDTGNIQVRPNTSLVGASGTDHLERLRLCDTSDGTVEEVKAGYLFVFIGAAPCTEWLDGVVERDRKGFVVTGPDLLAGGRRPRGWPLDRDPYYLEASVPGVFAAGDARANSVKRVASAVGEGAMAIQLVHGYLEAQ